MTAYEVIEMIAILTDDSQSWFPYENGRDWTFLFQTIDQAQLRVIEKYYTLGDEKALRTLYEESNAANDYYVPNFLYPRALILKDVYTADNVTTINLYDASYQDYETYINLQTSKTCIYTVKGVYVNNIMYTYIYTNSADSGTFYYIKQPANFFWDDTGIKDSTLLLPLEYHMEACCLAAEMLNNLDTMENERSAAMSRDSALTMEGLVE